MLMLGPSKHNLIQIVNLIPECQILSGFINDKELNNKSYLPESLSCRIYLDKTQALNKETIPSTYSEYNFDSTKFLSNKARNYMIAELTPEIKNKITKLCSYTVCINPGNSSNHQLYLEAFKLSNDNYYDFMTSRFDNWYFTPEIQKLKSNKPNHIYISDKPSVNGIVINESIAKNHFIINFLEYLQISPNAKIANIWCLEYERILLSYIDNGQEFLFYYLRY